MGRSVLVTGGSRGIGKAIALRLAREGATRVAIGYMRSDAAAEETAAELQALGAEPVLVRGNVTSDRVLEQIARARAARRLRSQRGDGRDPAGARDRGQALGLDAERERARVPRADPRDRAVDAHRLVDRRDLEPRARSACSRTTPSSAPRRPRSSRSCATSRSSSARPGSASTRSPAASSTRARSTTSRTARRCSRWASRNAAGRMVTPEDMAGAVAFLCSPDADMVRGQTLIVDGGFSLPA